MNAVRVIHPCILKIIVVDVNLSWFYDMADRSTSGSKNRPEARIAMSYSDLTRTVAWV